MSLGGIVARNIRRLRLERGLTQEALAVDAGIDRTYVSRLERGLENPTVAFSKNWRARCLRTSKTCSPNRAAERAKTARRFACGAKHEGQGKRPSAERRATAHVATSPVQYGRNYRGSGVDAGFPED
jgi:transcriptional regulator with XRE-family HTH domain